MKMASNREICPSARSPYFQGLDEKSKARYEQKLIYINGIDPYTIGKHGWSSDPKDVPSITYPDIVNYLLFSPSPYTLEDLRCFKGLEAYNQFVSGWVRDVTAFPTQTGDKLVIVHGRVMHSQRLRETALHPWIIVQKGGKIIAAHCDCMAGLGETCTHVCSVLFYLDTKVRIRDAATVTQEAAYWKLPTSLKTAKYLPLHQIHFTSAKSKKRKLDQLIVEAQPGTSSKRRPASSLAPSHEDMNRLFEELSHCDPKSALLTILPGYSHLFARKESNDFPDVLSDLYSPDLSNLNYIELLEKCSNIEVTITPHHAQCVEKATRTQATNKLWFHHRAGRITASRMKSACRTNPDQPAQSLIKSICYPGKGFSTQAMEWGCTHEKQARDKYVLLMEDNHINFSVRDSGLVINPKYPHIGASPDGVVCCDCCGVGVLEVKCPHCAKDMNIAEYVSEAPSACLQTGDDEILHLQNTHTYMYQVQTQLGVCEYEYADFVVWTNNDIHLERILPDKEIWQQIISRSFEFFQKAILPELVGKFYSKGHTGANVDKKRSNTEQYCYCRKGEDMGDMIG